MFTRVSATTSG